MTRIELVLRLASLAKNTSSGDGGASIRVEVEISNQKPQYVRASAKVELHV